ncbi:hypothetical protein QTO34_001506 [Cnephaeus nilssonii]|uniref:Uncharacterized protein n=1 Tax=Cnephaeus nilssonii TaxID=3371016 RepID=A0AA40HWT0_CNENI|nr:hypothetical protein QTO34_001506 [Eptesicus nilssonii]
MAGAWLLLLLALGCPALPTGVGGTPFPSLAPPITMQVDGKQQVLVVCLVLDAAPPGLESPSGSPLATAAPWTPSPTALPRLQTAPGLAWPSSPCPRRSWHPGKPWSVTPGLGLGIIARAHSPYSCQERLPQRGPASGNLLGVSTGGQDRRCCWDLA